MRSIVIDQARVKQAAKAEMERLQGTWQLVAVEVFGQGRSFKGPKEEVALEKVIIKGDNRTLRRAKVVVKSGIERKETEQQARYELDPTKKPKTIDLVWTDGDEKRKTYPGIYSLEGDTLKICYAREGTVRPPGFTAEATKEIKDHCVLMVLKREKVEKSDLENLQDPRLPAARVVEW